MKPSTGGDGSDRAISLSLFIHAVGLSEYELFALRACHLTSDNHKPTRTFTRMFGYSGKLSKRL